MIVVNKKKRVLALLLSGVCIGILIFGITAYVHHKKIDNYIVDLNIVYTPNAVAKKTHREIFSIDSFDYWVFELNENQKSEINRELTNGNWTNEKNDYCYKAFSFVLTDLNMENILYDEDTYVCIYDYHNKKVTQVEESSEKLLPEQNLVFLYNQRTGLYLCCYFTF